MNFKPLGASTRTPLVMKQLLWVLCVLSGCTAAVPTFAKVSEGGTVTVFVHGYKGAFLDTDDGSRRAWLSVGQLTSAGHESLALPWPGQPHPPTFPHLVPAGPVTKFTAIPLIISEDIYLSWLEFGRDHLPGFVPFAYDWRQDIRASGGQLCDFLKSLPASKIQLVGHSMGGLVTWSCLTQHPELAAKVTKVVFAGTPFRGGAGIFDDLFVGSRTGANVALLSREALFSFPSAWQLLAAKSDFFVDAAGAPVVLDAFSASEWVNRKWGVFAERSTEADRVQLEKLLSAHAAVAAMIEHEPLPSSIALLAVIGTGRPTVSGVRVLDAGFDFEHPATADGDGSVVATSALVPQPFTRLDTSAEHVQLLNDHAVQAALDVFLH